MSHDDPSDGHCRSHDDHSTHRGTSRDVRLKNWLPHSFIRRPGWCTRNEEAGSLSEQLFNTSVKYQIITIPVASENEQLQYQESRHWWESNLISMMSSFQFQVIRKYSGWCSSSSVLFIMNNRVYQILIHNNFTFLVEKSTRNQLEKIARHSFIAGLPSDRRDASCSFSSLHCRIDAFHPPNGRCYTRHFLQCEQDCFFPKTPSQGLQIDVFNEFLGLE